MKHFFVESLHMETNFSTTPPRPPAPPGGGGGGGSRGVSRGGPRGGSPDNRSHVVHGGAPAELGAHVLRGGHPAVVALPEVDHNGVGPRREAEELVGVQLDDLEGGRRPAGPPRRLRLPVLPRSHRVELRLDRLPARARAPRPSSLSGRLQADDHPGRPRAHPGALREHAEAIPDAGAQLLAEPGLRPESAQEGGRRREVVGGAGGGLCLLRPRGAGGGGGPPAGPPSGPNLKHAASPPQSRRFPRRRVPGPASSGPKGASPGSEEGSGYRMTRSRPSGYRRTRAPPPPASPA